MSALRNPLVLSSVSNRADSVNPNNALSISSTRSAYLDLDGERVATLKDVIVRLGEDEHPPVAGFVARYRRRDFFLPRWRIAHFGEDGVRLVSDILDLRPFMRRDGEVLLARDVLDKQLVDVDGSAWCA